MMAELENIIEPYKQGAVRGMDWFLRSFSHVPDDKLDWTPTPTAKSAIRIAAHTALHNAFFAKLIRDQILIVGDEIPIHVARMVAAEKALTDRAEVESVFRKGTDEVLAALDALTPEAIALELDSSLGWTMPMTFLMRLPEIHAITHAGQIDYLQTCWDDQEIYFS
jgi:hypothetical protein